LTKKGRGSPWILGVLVLLLFINAAYALFELVANGVLTEINLLSIVGGTLLIPLAVYFVISALIASLAFGFFTSRVVQASRQIGILEAFEDLKATIHSSTKQLEQVVTEDLAKFSLDQFAIDSDMKSIKALLKKSQEKTELANETFERFSAISKNQFAIDSDMKSIKALLKKSQEKTELANETFERFSAISKNQIVLLNGLRNRIAKIESHLKPRTGLTASSSVKKVVGVGQKKAKDLESIGIAKVGDLVFGNVVMIAKRTGIPEGNVAKIQAAAQLLMIPGMSPKTVRLLQKAEVKTMEELACQNPLELFMKTVACSKARRGRPSLRDMASYVAFAQYYTGHIRYNDTISAITFPEEVLIR
jgi:glycerol-3-phosphate cytidylyltransferase-like family protein